MDAFEDLEVWKRSSSLAINIYRALNTCKEYSLKDQVFRSSLSISSNIAEGFERNSNKQFVHYLQIAKASCGELRSQLIICREIGLIPDKQSSVFIAEATLISKMIYGLIRHCKNQ